jgi:hypothetical protein
VAVALLATSGGGASRTTPRATREHPAAGSSRAPAPAPGGPPDTEAGATAAATTWCQTTDAAFFTGTWDSAVSALATPAFAALAERAVGPASALARRRLAAAHVHHAVRVWPLAYRLEQYSPAAARVRVWQLLAFGIQGPLDQTAFFTTTVSLLRTGGTWRVTSAPPGPDLTPPRPGAPARRVATWVTAVDQLKEYRYAP